MVFVQGFLVFMIALLYHVWTSHSDVSDIQHSLRSGELFSNGDCRHLSITTGEPRHCDPQRGAGDKAMPLAAVVIPATWLLPDHEGLTEAYRDRLQLGYSFALLGGAPWVVLTGSPDECATAARYLQTLRHPHETLLNKRFSQWFPKAPEISTKIAALMRERQWTSLADWRQEAHSIPAFELLQRTGPIEQLVHTMGSLSMVSDNPSSLHTRLLAAFAVSSSSSGGYVNLEVYDRHTPTAERAEDGSEATAAAGGYSGVFGALESMGEWQLPRRWIADTEEPWELILPGIVAVPSADATDEVVIDGTREIPRLIEWSVVARFAHRRGWRHEDDWWLLNRTYAIAIIAHDRHQPRFIKLLYQHSLRKLVLRSRERLVEEMNRMRRLVQRGTTSAPSPRSHEEGDAAQPAIRAESLFPFTEDNAKVFVITPFVNTVERVRPSPLWLSFKDELPPGVDAAGCSWVTRRLGVYSHYLYRNYRRWADSLQATADAGRGPGDATVLLRNLVHGFREGNIRWSDITGNY